MKPKDFIKLVKQTVPADKIHSIREEYTGGYKEVLVSLIDPKLNCHIALYYRAEYLWLRAEYSVSPYAPIKAARVSEALSYAADVLKAMEEARA